MRRRIQINIPRYAIAMLTLGFILLVLLIGIYAKMIDNRFQCLAEYNANISERQQRLGNIAAEDRDLTRQAENNFDDLIITVSKAERTEDPSATVRDAFGLYKQNSRTIESRRRELDRQRQADPLPAPPTETCN